MLLGETFPILGHQSREKTNDGYDLVDEIYDPRRWIYANNDHNDDGYRLLPVPLRNLQNYGDGFEN